MNIAIWVAVSVVAYIMSFHVVCWILFGTDVILLIKNEERATNIIVWCYLPIFIWGMIFKKEIKTSPHRVYDLSIHRYKNTLEKSLDTSGIHEDGLASLTSLKNIYEKLKREHGATPDLDQRIARLESMHKKEQAKVISFEEEKRKMQR